MRDAVVESAGNFEHMVFLTCTNIVQYMGLYATIEVRPLRRNMQRYPATGHYPLGVDLAACFLPRSPLISSCL